MSFMTIGEVNVLHWIKRFVCLIVVLQDLVGSSMQTRSQEVSDYVSQAFVITLGYMPLIG